MTSAGSTCTEPACSTARQPRGGPVKRPPVPRPRIYDLDWYSASQRQQMFTRRVAGEPGPWPDDPILGEFKFCNVFRAADSVSQCMIRDACYHNEPCTPEDLLFPAT